MEILPLVGASLTVSLGVLGMVRPGVAADIVGIVPEGKVGLSEVRATYGGIFLGLGVGCFWLRSPEAYFVVALAWLGATVARVASIVIERSLSRENIAGVVVEAGIGGLLLIGAFPVAGIR